MRTSGTSSRDGRFSATRREGARAAGWTGPLAVQWEQVEQKAAALTTAHATSRAVSTATAALAGSTGGAALLMADGRHHDGNARAITP
ncbi:conserved hypothetical protein [Paraburkholderia caribensis]|nr:conserved hypothetical protein [Paraburkholderia caribensis]